MIEYVRREGARVGVDQKASPGQFINPRGSEARAGEILLHPGLRLDFTAIAMLAAAGQGHVQMYAAPRA